MATISLSYLSLLILAASLPTASSHYTSANTEHKGASTRKLAYSGGNPGCVQSGFLEALHGGAARQPVRVRTLVGLSKQMAITLIVRSYLKSPFHVLDATVIMASFVVEVALRRQLIDNRVTAPACVLDQRGVHSRCGRPDKETA